MKCIVFTILVITGCSECFVDFQALDALRHKVHSAFVERNAEELLEMMNGRSQEDIELLQTIIDERMQGAESFNIPAGTISSDKIELQLDYGGSGRDTMIIYFINSSRFSSIQKIDYIYGGGFMRTIGR